MTPHRALALYRAIYVALSVVAGALTMRAVTAATNDHRLIIGGVEIIAALLLLAARTQIVGLVGLLFVYGVAGATEMAGGAAPPLRLVHYAAGAIFIVVLDRALREAQSKTR